MKALIRLSRGEVLGLLVAGGVLANLGLWLLPLSAVGFGVFGAVGLGCGLGIIGVGLTGR